MDLQRYGVDWMEARGPETKKPFPRDEARGREPVFVPVHAVGKIPRCRRSEAMSRAGLPARPTDPGLPGRCAQWRAGGSACRGLTAAGPLPICTGFPIKLTMSTRDGCGS
ncbi:hypothetical protein ASZ90_001122 [hydrocarbon metagenome]|uniref:Uncharacterized protein n=1 Tax=hydrocarbon metagenome TaxID=938273 RepID=A0A0W8G793_9ZZZZ